MITILPNDKLAKLGRRYNTMQLIEQAGYTIQRAADDGPALAALLPDGFVDEMRACLKNLEEVQGNQTGAKSDSKQATMDQNDWLRKAQTWRHRVTLRANQGRMLGRQVPDVLLRMGRLRRLPAIAEMVDIMTGTLKEYGKDLPGQDVARLADEGAEIGRRLWGADAHQEVKRGSALPDATHALNIAKGMLYTGLLVLNEAGKELHADSPGDQKSYGMMILYRKAGRKKGSKNKKTADANETGGDTAAA